jgi:hypothetical protein
MEFQNETFEIYQSKGAKSKPIPKKKEKNYKNKSFEMKLLKITNPKAQNQSQYLKKRKKKLLFNFLKITEFRNETFETY